MAKRKTKAQMAEEIRVAEEKKAEEVRLADLREKYSKFRQNALYGATSEEWNEAVATYAKDHFGDKPTPEQWVEAAEKAATKCDRCNGSGRVEWGACVNGRMTNSGTCYRCAGKGYFTQDDHHRNRIYDNHRKVI